MNKLRVTIYWWLWFWPRTITLYGVRCENGVCTMSYYDPNNNIVTEYISMIFIRKVIVER